MAGRPAPGLVTGQNPEVIDLRHYPALIVLLALAACGDHRPPEPQGDSVWKEQTDMIDQAQGIEGMIDDISAQQRRQIDQQAQ